MLNQMIKDLREKKNITRAELSKQTGIAYDALRNIERKLTSVSPHQLKVLIKVLQPDNPKEWNFYFLAQKSAFPQAVLRRLCSVYLGE